MAPLAQGAEVTEERGYNIQGYVCVCVFMHMCVCVCVCVCVHVFLYVHACVCVRACACVCGCVRGVGGCTVCVRQPICCDLTLVARFANGYCSRIGGKG